MAAKRTIDEVSDFLARFMSDAAQVETDDPPYIRECRESGRLVKSRLGLPMLAKRGGVVTLEMVQAIQEELDREDLERALRCARGEDDSLATPDR